MPPEVCVVQQPERCIYGLQAPSGDKTVARDIPALARKYHEVTNTLPNSVLPFYVLSQEYDPETGLFTLFCGGETPCEGLEALALPAGACAKMTLRPKMGFLWGPAVGQAKRYFYTQWLPGQEYVALNREYEYHTQKSMGKKPEIELFFAIEHKA